MIRRRKRSIETFDKKGTICHLDEPNEKNSSVDDVAILSNIIMNG